LIPCRVLPQCEAAPAGEIGALTPAQIVVKPISKTRCQPGDDSE